ncbi:hypothetical protein NK604_004777 [Vibrio parahaemolyticus]|nr:hypothetical protein [Vibrio parahaemolyticus]EJK2413650.1 hypothetical protein [Vibrio parahaemolyticus]HDV0904599.1 hypothetical protein [Vibrio fluvialis]
MENDKSPLVNVIQKSGLGSDTEQVVNVHVNNYERAYKHLATINASNLTFNPEQLKIVIESIDSGLNDCKVEGSVSFEPGICIVSKNKLNNLEQEFFDDIVVMEFYPQFNKIDRFLELRVNEPLKDKVDRIILSLNRRIRAYNSKNMFFQELLYEVCNTLIDREKEALEDKEEQVLLVLFYFYCHCCIGKKTEEEKNAST